MGGANMNNRIRTGDKFKVIDRESPYFDQTVIFSEVNTQDLEIINRSGKTVKRGKIFRGLFKTEGAADLVEFTTNQLERL